MPEIIDLENSAMFSTSVEMSAYSSKCAKNVVIRIVNQRNIFASTLGNVNMLKSNFVEFSRRSGATGNDARCRHYSHEKLLHLVLQHNAQNI